MLASGSRLLIKVRSLCLVALCLAAFGACRTTSPSTPEPAEPVDKTPIAQETPDRKPFDPQTITPEEKRNTMVDIDIFIEELNQVIQRRDYDLWLGYLTKAYIDYYSSEAVLDEWSQFPVLKRQGVVLKSLKDFFFYIVYPSRGNAKPDDIEYLDYELIKVMAINSKGERVILYYLEKVGNSWKMTVRR